MQCNDVFICVFVINSCDICDKCVEMVHDDDIVDPIMIRQMMWNPNHHKVWYCRFLLDPQIQSLSLFSRCNSTNNNYYKHKWCDWQKIWNIAEATLRKKKFIYHSVRRFIRIKLPIFIFQFFSTQRHKNRADWTHIYYRCIYTDLYVFGWEMGELSPDPVGLAEMRDGR